MTQPTDAALGEVTLVLTRDGQPLLKCCVVFFGVVVKRLAIGHRRLKPKRLRKKLEKITSIPSISVVTAGMTSRNVFSYSNGPNERAPHTPSAEAVSANPTSSRPPPLTKPVSSVIQRKSLFRRWSSGSNPSLIAKTLAR